MSPETLAPDIAWEPSGHLSEVALSVVADGEDALLDAAMRAHLDGCEACALQLGGVAMRAATVATALRDPAAAAVIRDVRAPMPASVAQAFPIGVAPSWLPPVSVRAPKAELTRPRKVPVRALVPALLVAALGAVPSMWHAPAQVAQAWSVLRQIGPAFVRVAPSALAKAWGGPRGTMVVMAVWMLAGALVVAGLGIAKQQSKKLVVDGGRR